jgi:hypothetical protein
MNYKGNSFLENVIALDVIVNLLYLGQLQISLFFFAFWLSGPVSFVGK